MTSPRVTVVVLCKDQSQYLPFALRSLQLQTEQRFEVIVVTGDDESQSIAEPVTHALFGTRVPWQVIHLPPHGRGDALNRALARATAPYFARLDADDMYAPNYLERILANAPDDPERIIVRPSMLIVGPGETRELRMLDYAPSTLRDMNIIPTSSLCSLDLWKLTRFPVALSAYEDWAFWLRCAPLEPSVLTANDAVLRYRIHAGQASETDTPFHALHVSAMRLAAPYLLTPNMRSLCCERLRLFATPGPGETPAAERTRDRMRERVAQHPDDALARELASLGFGP